MANKLIRIYGRGRLHFITFSCYRRIPCLRSVRAKNAFVQILGKVRDRYKFSLVGHVVMPEHIHLLISEAVKGTLSTVIHVLKQRVSRRLRRKKRASAGQLNFAFARGGDSLPRVWQRRFYDCNVWSLKKRAVDRRTGQRNVVPKITWPLTSCAYRTTLSPEMRRHKPAIS